MKRFIVSALALLILLCAALFALDSCAQDPGNTSSGATASEAGGEETSSNPYGSFAPTSKSDDVSVDANDFLSIAPPQPYASDETC